MRAYRTICGEPLAAGICVVWWVSAWGSGERVGSREGVCTLCPTSPRTKIPSQANQALLGLNRRLARANLITNRRSKTKKTKRMACVGYCNCAPPPPNPHGNCPQFLQLQRHEIFFHVGVAGHLGLSDLGRPRVDASLWHNRYFGLRGAVKGSSGCR